MAPWVTWGWIEDSYRKVELAPGGSRTRGGGHTFGSSRSGSTCGGQSEGAMPGPGGLLALLAGDDLLGHGEVPYLAERRLV